MPLAVKIDYVPSILEDTDIRSVIRLLGEVAVLEIDLTQKKERLLNGMCRLIDGDGWAWSLTGPSELGPVCLDRLSGGETQAVPHLPAPATSTELLPAKLRRGDIATGDRSLTIFARQISDDKMSQLYFCRREGRAPFSPREEMMTRIFCEEVAWLHDPPRERVPTKLPLTPRETATLTLLIEGLSHKEIAARLRLSPNTVHGYIKQLYRHFNIHSHAELMKRFPLTKK